MYFSEVMVYSNGRVTRCRDTGLSNVRHRTTPMRKNNEHIQDICSTKRISDRRNYGNNYYQTYSIFAERKTNNDGHQRMPLLVRQARLARTNVTEP